MNNNEVFINARKCSYDPMQDLIDVTYDNDKHSAYLQVPHRLIWFATYCAEKGFTGFVDDGDVKYIPELALMQATASVFINGTMVGRSSAGCAAITSPSTTPFRPQLPAQRVAPLPMLASARLPRWRVAILRRTETTIPVMAEFRSSIRRWS